MSTLPSHPPAMIDASSPSGGIERGTDDLDTQISFVRIRCWFIHIESAHGHQREKWHRVGRSYSSRKGDRATSSYRYYQSKLASTPGGSSPAASDPPFLATSRLLQHPGSRPISLEDTATSSEFGH